MWRLVYAIPSWIFIIVITIPIYLLGWILVPIAAGLRKYYVSEYNGHKVVYHFTWKWMLPWDNWEDGIANATYWTAPNMFLQIIYWSCIRNPTNNLRIVPYLSCKINPARVCWIGTNKSSAFFDRKPAEVEWFFAWQGIYSCYWNQFMWRGHIWRLWIGWQIYPSDTQGVTPYRIPGAGFALQFKKID